MAWQLVDDLESAACVRLLPRSLAFDRSSEPTSLELGFPGREWITWSIQFSDIVRVESTLTSAQGPSAKCSELVGTGVLERIRLSTCCSSYCTRTLCSEVASRWSACSKPVAHGTCAVVFRDVCGCQWPWSRVKGPGRSGRRCCGIWNIRAYVELDSSTPGTLEIT